ncbi:MAG: hypothetical protein JWL69_610 [Phycisphaerales bacterium]|nr:hypothetical protein [Phycisphaerales bacterium]
MRRQPHHRRAHRLAAARLAFAAMVLGFGGRWPVTRLLAGEQSREAERHEPVHLPAFERVGPVADGAGYGAPIFSHDSRAFIACEGAAVRVWNSRTLEPLSKSLRQDAIKYYGLSADGSMAFTADDKEFRIWNVSSSKLLSATKATDGKLGFASLGPDGTRFITIADHHDAVTVWRRDQAKPTFSLRHEQSPGSAVFDPGGKRIVTDDGLIHIFDADSGKEICPPIEIEYEYHFEDVRVSFDPTGRRLLIPRGHGYTLVETETGKVLNRVQYDDMSGPAVHVRFSADGSRIAVTSGTQLKFEPARIYDAQTGKLERQVGSDIYDCQVGPQGRWALLMPFNSKLEFWDLKSGARTQILEEYGASVSPDGSLLLFEAHGNLRDVLRLRDVPEVDKGR